MNLPLPSEKLKFADSLRGLAILSVIVVHTSQYGTPLKNQTIQQVLNEGARGVQLFYLVSAFTLFLSFKNRSQLERFPVRNFFLRRFFRIAPMYYIGILYFLWQDGLGERYWLGDQETITPLNIAANFLFLHGFNPYWITSLVPGGWTIAVEMTFYAVLPLLFLRITNINQAIYFFISTLILSFILGWYLSVNPLIPTDRLWQEYLFLYFPSQLPVFALGIIFYFHYTSQTRINGLAFISLSLILIVNFVRLGGFSIPNHIMFGAAYMLLAIGMSRYQFSLLENTITIFIGKLSFSMYLVHFAVLHWLDNFALVDMLQHTSLNYALRLLLVTLITISISFGCFHLLEVPFQKLGKKIISLFENRAVTS
jgi:peptidoglycan/LPS O-acetylase OafA/YrhL